MKPPPDAAPHIQSGTPSSNVDSPTDGIIGAAEVDSVSKPEEVAFTLRDVASGKLGESSPILGNDVGNDGGNDGGTILDWESVNTISELVDSVTTLVDLGTMFVESNTVFNVVSLCTVVVESIITTFADDATAVDDPGIDDCGSAAVEVPLITASDVGTTAAVDVGVSADDTEGASTVDEGSGSISSHV